jgi:SAM-dependent methyltransferase
MTEVWESAFSKHQPIWGLEPTASAIAASERFARHRVASVLIPGIGYGRNAQPFLDRGMAVTGIEISETAIAFARSKLHLDIPIHHGSVADMPFDDRTHDAIFCFGLLYLLDASGRAKLLRDCARQLSPGGLLVFTLISKQFESYGKGTQLGEDWYETGPGVRLFFYDETSIRRELGVYGTLEIAPIAEPMPDGSLRPFLHVTCHRT